MPAKKLHRVTDLFPRDIRVTARIGVQGLGRRSEQVEEGQAVVSRELLVVPLLQHQDRDGDLTGGAGEGGLGVGGPDPEQPEDGGGDARLGGDERDPEPGPHRQPEIADRPVRQVVHVLGRVHGGLPVGDRLLGRSRVPLPPDVNPQPPASRGR